MRRHSVLSIMLALAAVSACSPGNDQSPDYGPLVAVFRADTASTLLLSGFSGFRAPARLVVTDAATWSEVWAQAVEPYEPKDPAPGVDFGEDGVIVAANGTASNSGHRVTVDSVGFFEAGQKVYVTRESTDASCATLSVMTNQVHMVRVPRPLNQVTFEETTRVVSCGN